MPSICHELTSALLVVATMILPLQSSERPASVEQTRQSQGRTQQGQTQQGQGQQGQGQQGQGQQGQGQQGQTQQTQDVKYKETVVVSASKTEQQLVNAPATMSVIGPEILNIAPSTNYGDLLRGVPGMNVTQISARDVNVTSRGATSSLATSQLAVVDGRSIYQDFFGFVMWDFMPANTNEIKQMEVIRGPASAVWGANALNGVINVITKSPREMQGTYAVFGGGAFDRDVEGAPMDSGSVFYVNGTYAAAANDRWAYKISAGTYFSDAFARPVGEIPNGIPNDATTYPAYNNTGTSQPKVDVRVDYDRPDNGGKFSFSGGVGGTDGIMHSGIGPFDIDTGTTLSYGKMAWTKGARRVQVFLNALNGEATNLLTIDPQGRPIDFVFDTKTFDMEYGETKTIGTKHALTFGGNLRLNFFELTIAPGEDSRTEGGAYIQDEIFFNDTYRLSAGARIDKFSSIDGAVFSPRVAFLVKPHAEHSFRASYNRAFRSPSMINNNLAVTIAQPVPMNLFNPGYGSLIYLLPVDADGYPDLTETRLDAFEIGYTGIIRNRAVVSAAWFYNITKDDIFFTQVAEYTPADPPPGFPNLGPFPGPAVWALAYAQGARLPKAYSYRNLGTVDQTGFEIGIDTTLTRGWNLNVNYSFQADPVPDFTGLTEEQALREINQPANNRFNVGVSYTGDRFFGNVGVNYVGDAFWQDVLDARYSGTTEAYTAVNLTAGMIFARRYTAALKITNLTNEAIMQHVFGDVIRRQIVGELRVSLPK
jgi:iron complex outermembrane receptor protein